MNKIYAIGEALLDKIDGVSYVGGAPLNFITAVNYFYKDSSFITVLAKDSDGKLINQAIKDEGLDRTNLTFNCELVSPYSLVTNNEEGDREFRFHFQNSTIDHLYKASFNFNTLCHDILYYGTVPLMFINNYDFYLSFLEKTYLRNILIFDPNIRLSLFTRDKIQFIIFKLLPFAQIVKLSEDELEIIFTKHRLIDASWLRRKVKKLFNICPHMKMLVLTRGSKGSTVYLNDGTKVKNKAKKIKAIDTTGAGDTYFGTFIAQLVLQKYFKEPSKEKIEKAMKKASEISSKICLKKGCLPIKSYLDSTKGN